MIEAILFDFDGVLVSTVDMHAKAFRKALDTVWSDRPLMLEVDVEERLNGLSSREKLRYLTAACGLPATLHDAIWQEKQRATRDAIREEIVPDPAKVGMMTALSREGYRLGCVSNAIRETTVLALQACDLYRFFEFVLTNQDVARQKPHPDPYLEAFRMLNLSPRKCLIVEDSPHGIRAALDSGAHLLVAESYKDVTGSFVYAGIRHANGFMF